MASPEVVPDRPAAAAPASQVRSWDRRGPAEGGIKAPTLASVVARRIEDEVVADGWPIGKVLGSESDLLARFGVSRAVLREAVRIVEHTGAAQMRRGPGGGLVVARPNRDALVAAVGVWFSYVGATMAEMLEIRRPLLLQAVRLASQRIGPDAGSELLASAADLGSGPHVRLDELAGLESQIVAATGNPSLALFVDALGDLGAGRLRGGWAEIRPPLTFAELASHVEGYRALAAAVASHRAEGAVALTTTLLDKVAPHIFDLQQAGPGIPVNPSNGKLAEQVARAVRDDIERAGWPVGAVLGSETEMIERHAVSRAILREAVRILEHHGAVRTKRGPHGGLLVTAPDLAAVRRSARLYLEYEGVTPTGLSETRSIVEVVMTRMAAERCTPETSASLQSVLDAEGDGHDTAINFMHLHEELAVMAGNRLLRVFVEVLGDIVPGHVKDSHRSGEAFAATSDAAHRAHVRIVEAVRSGDADAAGRRMSRHLQASSDVLQ